MKTKLKDFTSFCNLVSVPVLLYSIAEKKIISANDLSEELFGYDKKELINIDIIKMFAAQNRKNIEALIEIASAGADGFKLKEGDLHIRRKTGRRCPVEIACSVLHINEEKLLLFNIIDLTGLHLKQNEKELLIQDNLRISKLADLSRLASGMAHELNNPLAIISGYTEYLDEYLGKPEKNYETIKKNIKPIRNNITRMSNIISKLMKMFRSEEIKFSTVGVKSLVNLALSTIKNQIENTNIIISLDIEDLNVNCDILYTEQVVINILNNSITALSKYTDIRFINIKTSETPKEICISINNNGAPIPEQYHDKIFTPFFTTKQVGEGVGLGLYLAQNIMRIHEGRITFETNPKIGTTFNLIFPKRSALFGNLEQNKKTILICSESSDFRKNLYDLFTNSGFKVLESRDHLEAGSVIANSHVDSILFEVDFTKFTQIDGITKLIYNYSEIPMVILTNNTNNLELKRIEKIKNVYIFSNEVTSEEVKDISLVIDQYQSIKELKSA